MKCVLCGKTTVYISKGCAKKVLAKLEEDMPVEAEFLSANLFTLLRDVALAREKTDLKTEIKALAAISLLVSRPVSRLFTGKTSVEPLKIGCFKSFISVAVPSDCTNKRARRLLSFLKSWTRGEHYMVHHEKASILKELATAFYPATGFALIDECALVASGYADVLIDARNEFLKVKLPTNVTLLQYVGRIPGCRMNHLTGRYVLHAAHKEALWNTLKQWHNGKVIIQKESGDEEYIIRQGKVTRSQEGTATGRDEDRA